MLAYSGPCNTGNCMVLMKLVDSCPHPKDAQILLRMRSVGIDGSSSHWPTVRKSVPPAR